MSGEPKKLDALGHRYGVKRLCGYDEADELFASGEIDAVYLALPNNMHKEFTGSAGNGRRYGRRFDGPLCLASPDW